jgi:hypothetical protein
MPPLTFRAQESRLAPSIAVLRLTVQWRKNLQPFSVRRSFEQAQVPGIGGGGGAKLIERALAGSAAMRAGETDRDDAINRPSAIQVNQQRSRVRPVASQPQKYLAPWCC